MSTPVVAASSAGTAKLTRFLPDASWRSPYAASPKNMKVSLSTVMHPMLDWR